MGDNDRQLGPGTINASVNALASGPSIDEDRERVEIHKPKPVHGWREFISEVGIIVLGVLIALSAEQGVESIHWRHKVEAVKEAVRHELVEDDLPQAYARVVIGHCLGQQLDRLRLMAKPGSDGAAFLRAAALYSPPNRTWDTDALKLVEQSDLAAHLSTADLDAIQGPYRYVSRMEPVSQEEIASRVSLQRSRYGAGTLTVEDSAQISDTIDTLQIRNRALAASSFALLQKSEPLLGAQPSADVKRRVLMEAREVYGDCASEFVPPNNLGDRQVNKPTGQSVFRGI